MTGRHRKGQCGKPPMGYCAVHPPSTDRWGPVIVLVASLFFLGSLLFGSRASVRARLSHPVHLRG